MSTVCTSYQARQLETKNEAVIDRRLRPRCCHLWSYTKHTSFSCRYIRKDIMCKHDVMNIQHADCGLVGLASPEK